MKYCRKQNTADSMRCSTGTRTQSQVQQSAHSGTCEEAVTESWPCSTRPSCSLISVSLGLRGDLQGIHADSGGGRETEGVRYMCIERGKCVSDD